MPSPLAPYLPYVTDYLPYLTIFNGCASCGDISDILETDGVTHGCDVCQWATNENRCLFNSDDPLYSIFQTYLHSNHPELFI